MGMAKYLAEKFKIELGMMSFGFGKKLEGILSTHFNKWYYYHKINTLSFANKGFISSI